MRGAFTGVNTNDLWTVTPDNLNHEISNLPMGKNTSPSITYVPGGGGFVAARESGGQLVTYTPSGGAFETQILVDDSSSPSIAAPAQFFTNVPNVLGQTQASAQNVLTTANLTVGSVTSDHSRIGLPGTVTLESPGTDAQIALGAPVSLRVATGTDPGGKPCVFK